jgi:hypothetical protein
VASSRGATVKQTTDGIMHEPLRNGRLLLRMKRRLSLVASSLAIGVALVFGGGAYALDGSFIDTTQADFQAGTPGNVDLTTSPGDVILAVANGIDQQNTNFGTSGVGITTTTWGGQTFTPSVTGTLTRVDINLFCVGCTGTTPDLTLSLRATSGGLPTGADIASATISGFNNGAAVFYSATFGSPPTVTAGTQYALVIRPTANPSPGTYALTRSGTATTGSDVYAGGTRVTGATSGTVWSILLTGGVSTDAGFKAYILSGYATSGTFVSSVKDSNPPAGGTVDWDTLSWTATVPAATGLTFQVAASNNPTGPFNFVGPDGTANTTFTNGGSLAQFDGLRYLEYQATFTTSDTSMTPTLHDVSISDQTLQPQTIVFTPPSSGNVGDQLDLSNDASGGGSGEPVTFTVDTVDSSPSNTCSLAGDGVTLTLNHVGGTPPGSCVVDANQAGNSDYTAASPAAATIQVDRATQTITFTPPTSGNVGDQINLANQASGGNSGQAVTFSVDPSSGAGVCSVLASAVSLLGAGSCVIDANQAGNDDYSPAAQVQKTIAVVDTAPTITAGNQVSATQGGTPVPVDPALTLTDANSTTLDSASVAVTGGFAAGDTLAATTAGTSIRSSYTQTTGVLMLSGHDTLADYRQVLRSVAFSSPSTTAGDRTIIWTATSGARTSTPATTTVTYTIPMASGSAPTSCSALSGSGSVTGGVDCGATVTLSGSSSTASLTVPGGDLPNGARVSLTDVSSGGTSAAPVTGVSVGSLVVQLSVTAQDGSVITSFAQPLVLHIPASAAGAPEYSTDGKTWIPIARIFSQSPPNGQQTGYFLNADGSIDIYTRLAAYLAAMKPAPAAGLTGKLSGGKLKLSWQTGTPGPAIDHYLVLLNGTVIGQTATTAFEAHTFKARGNSSFVVLAVDVIGDQAPASQTLTVASTSRPKSAPLHIPRWAWGLLAWQERPAAQRGARPKAAPVKVPGWWSIWAKWRQDPYALAKP